MLMKLGSVVMILMIMWGSCLSEKPLNILISVSLSSRSHVKGLLEISQVLIERGHQIHYASPAVYFKYVEDYNVTLHELPTIPELMHSDAMTHLSMKQKVGRGLATKELSPYELDVFYKDHKTMFQSITKLTVEEQFDVVICDFFSTGCRDAVNNRKIPLIVGMQTINFLGIYDIPYLSYDMDGGSLSLEKMNFFGRLYDFIITWFINRKLQISHMNAINKSRKEMGVELNYDSLGPLDRNLVLSVSFFGFELPVHTPPNLKLVGPIKSPHYQPLTKDLEGFFETRSKVVYIGFGSLCIALPEDFHDIMLGLTMLLDKGVIDGVVWGLQSYQWNQTIHSSIKILPWTPQTAILNHPSTKLFISHGGIESISDAIFAGTPIMGFPQFGDQSINSAKVEHVGIGKVYSRLDSTPTKLADTAELILINSDELYRPNLIRLQKLAELRSRHGLTDGANIIEDYTYLSQSCRPRFSPSSSATPCELLHLLPASVSMGPTRAYNYDIYIFLSSCFTLLVVISLYLIYQLFRRVGHGTKKKID